MPVAARDVATVIARFRMDPPRLYVAYVTRVIAKRGTARL